MADIIDLMLATGRRIGEILALRWTTSTSMATRPNLTIRDDQDRDREGHLSEAHPEVGLQRANRSCFRFAVELLACAGSRDTRTRIDAVFPTRNGTWQQVDNVERRWRQIRKDTGLEWVTPHTFRKTVATLISEGSTPRPPRGSSATPPRRSPVSSTSPSRAIAADVADVLEELAESDDASSVAILRNNCGIRPSGSNRRTGSDPRFRRSEAVSRSG